MKNRKSSYNREELLACGRGELFEKDSPRLPVDEMLMADRITRISSDGGRYGRGELVAELDINPDLWFFDCHFLEDPVMPGCLGLDALWQLTGFFLAWSGYHGFGRALGADNIRFTGEVPPNSKQVGYHIHVRRILKASLIIGLADAIVSVDGNEIYHAQKLMAGVVTKSMAEAQSDHRLADFK